MTLYEIFIGHLLTGVTVYLECRAMSHEVALKAATETLKLIKQDWFNSPDLVIEDKYQSVVE